MIITIFLYILNENIFIERAMMVFIESIYPRLGNNSEAIGGYHYTAHNQSLTVQEISSANENYTCCRCVVVLAYWFNHCQGFTCDIVVVVVVIVVAAFIGKMKNALRCEMS